MFFYIWIVSKVIKSIDELPKNNYSTADKYHNSTSADLNHWGDDVEIIITKDKYYDKEKMRIKNTQE